MQGFMARSACRCSGPWAADSSCVERDVFDEERLFRLEDRPDEMRAVAIDRHAAPGERKASALARVPADDLQPPDLLIAPRRRSTMHQSAKSRTTRLSDGRQRLLVVERRGQHGARLGQEPLLLLDALAFRDVSQRHREDGLVADLQLRDRRLGGELFAVLAKAGDRGAPRSPMRRAVASPDGKRSRRADDGPRETARVSACRAEPRWPRPSSSRRSAPLHR